MVDPRRQRGLTILGFIFVAAVIVVVALVGFRVLPSYIEYYTVKKALEATLADTANVTPQEIRRALATRISADYIESVRATDVTVTKENNQIVATLNWQKILHMVGNASILLEFEASAAR
jgi:Tfp pilus assembly major pilin PilA